MKIKGDSISLISLIFILSAIMAMAGCAGTGTALSTAAFKGQTDVVKDILDKGADVNARSGCDWRFEQTMTALSCAAYGGHIETVKVLVERGADVNARSEYSGWTPLVFAAYAGQASIAKFLIEKGADVDDAMARFEKMTHGSDGFKFLERLVKKQQPPRQAETQVAKPAQEAYPAIKSDIDEMPAIMSEARKDAFAVVIGIENYRSIPKSDYSRSDATLVKAYLKALGFQERNIEFLTDEKATRTDIEKSLEAWLPSRAKKDSTVLVYFSGHGAPEPATGEAYLVPYDSDPNYLPVTGYPLKRLYASLGKLEASEIIVVLDSCFSGSGGRSVLAKGARPLVMMAPTGALSSNIAVLSATQGSQISTSSPQKGHGVFTYYFLKAIKDGKKNLAEIYEYITPQVEDEAKMLNVQQSPSISPDVEKIKNKFSLRK